MKRHIDAWIIEAKYQTERHTYEKKKIILGKALAAYLSIIELFIMDRQYFA